MSKAIYHQGGLYVTSFFGGTTRGTMLDFSPEYGKYNAELNVHDVDKLIEVLTAWVNARPLEEVD